MASTSRRRDSWSSPHTLPSRWRSAGRTPTSHGSGSRTQSSSPRGSRRCGDASEGPPGWSSVWSIRQTERMVSTEEYAPGRSIDIHGDGTKGLVLIWHGRGPNERVALSPLATAVAAQDIRVLVADWNSQADDGGRADLLTSMRYAREHADAIGLDPARLVVVGWSLGGTAAVSLAVHAKRLGL